MVISDWSTHYDKLFFKGEENTSRIFYDNAPVQIICISSLHLFW